MNENKYLIIIVFTILIIIILINIYNYQRNKSIEKFTINNNTSISTETLKNIGSNPQIDRRGNNVIANPATNLSNNLLIGSLNKLIGWNPPIPTKKTDEMPYLIVDLKKLMKVNAIATSGILGYKLLYSRHKDHPTLYEPILRVGDGRSELQFETNNTDLIFLVKDLETEQKEPVFARYIKLIPLHPSELTSSFVDSNTKIDYVINPKQGLKIEIFAIAPEAVPSTGGEPLTGQAKVLDENGKQINGGCWRGEKDNQDQQIKIVFSENNLTVPKVIYSVNFTSKNKEDQYVQEFSITYLHEPSNTIETVNNIKGNTSNNSNNTFTYYFEKPILATSLIIKPTKRLSRHIDPEMCFEVFGENVNQIQEKMLVDKKKEEKCSSESDQQCGSVSDLVSKQSDIITLCDALEQQEKIRENKMKIERNKKYHLQMEEQDKQIKKLEELMKDLTNFRKHRTNLDDNQLLEQKKVQDEMEMKLRKLAEERLENQKKFKVNLNIKEPVKESFTNYSETKHNFMRNYELNRPQLFYEDEILDGKSSQLSFRNKMYRKTLDK